MANTRFKTHHGIFSTANSFIDGKLEVTGDLSVSGNVSFSGTSLGDLKPDADQRNLGNTSLRWNLVGFAANLASTLTANGATSLSNTLLVTGATTLQNTLTVTGWVNTAANLVVGGSANVSGIVNIAGNTVVVGILQANGNTSFTNDLLTVNTNSGTGANTLTVGAANVSVDSGVLFVDAVNNRVGINNSAPAVALRVTGDADISSTANIQGNANVGGNLGVVGTTTITGNTTLNGTLQNIGGNTNFDNGVLFVDSVNNRVGINNTAPAVALRVTGAADVSSQVNSALLTVGSDFIANSTVLISTGTANVPVYYSGEINATSNGLLANSTSVTVGNSSVNVVVSTAGITSSGGTGINPSSNSVGTVLGTTTQRWNLTANTISSSGSGSIGTTLAAGNTTITGFANVTTSVNSAVFTVGTAMTANATGVYHTGSVNAASFTVGSSFIANSTIVNATSFTIGSNLIANTTGAYHTGTVNAAVVSVGSNFIANSSTVTIAAGVRLSANGSTGTAGHVLYSNGTVGSPYWAAPGVSSVSGTGTVSGLTLTGTVTSTGSLTLGGSLTLNSTQITTGLGYTPYNSTNPSGYISSVPNASTQVTSLGVGTAASGTTGEIRATGQITAGFSDKRLKNIISNIDSPLSKIEKLNGVYFTQNDLANEFGFENYDTQVGLIAQEVKEVLPEVVQIAPFDIDSNNRSKSGENYLTVQYEKLVPLLVEAIKQLKQEIDELKKNGNQG